MKTRHISIICAVAMSGCAQVTLPQQPSNGQAACLVRGLGGPLTSYLPAGTPVLQGLGYRVEVHDMGVSPAELEHCGVVVAHSLGAQPALHTHGPHDIFIVDGFAVDGLRCPDGARCTSFFNISNVTGLHVEGAENIAATGIDAVPLFGHMTMPASAEVWRQIAVRLSPTVEARR